MMVKPSNFLIVAGLPRGSRQIETATWQVQYDSISKIVIERVDLDWRALKANLA